MNEQRKALLQLFSVAALFVYSGSPTAAPNTDVWKASRLGDLRAVASALDHGTNINIPEPQDRERCTVHRDPGILGCDGRTPLMIASLHGHLPIVQLLLENGAQTDVSDIYGSDAMALAARGGHVEILGELLEAGANVRECSSPAILEGAFAGSIAITRSLIRAGSSVNCRFGFTQDFPLLAAAEAAHPKVVDLLIKSGARLDLTDLNGSNALLIAVRRQRARPSSARERGLQTIKILLNAGADPDQDLNRHGGALRIAAVDGQIEIMRLLIDSGADIAAKYKGESLLEYVRTGKGIIKRQAVINVLEEAGAK